MEAQDAKEILWAYYRSEVQYEGSLLYRLCSDVCNRAAQVGGGVGGHSLETSCEAQASRANPPVWRGTGSGKTTGHLFG